MRTKIQILKLVKYILLMMFISCSDETPTKPNGSLSGRFGSVYFIYVPPFLHTNMHPFLTALPVKTQQICSQAILAI